MLLAIATIFLEKSMPVGFAPSFLIAADTYPGPHATSNSVDQMKNELPRQ